MRRLAIASVAAVVVLLAACGDSMGRGIVITGQGKFGANTDRNQREAAEDALVEAILDEVGRTWTAKVAITELPVWTEDSRGGAPGEGDWRWERITARIDLVPPAGAVLEPAKRADIESGAHAYLKRKLQKPSGDAVAVTLVVAEPTAPAAAPASAPAAPAVATQAQTAPAQRSYVIQAGDTLAEISTAFYGTPIHWRRILAANPGLDAAALAPGQAIVIPPLAGAPAPAPPPAPAAPPAESAKP